MLGLDINSIVQIFALVLLLTYFMALVVLLITQWNNNDIRTVVTKQMKVFVLLPAGGLFALLIVALFQQAAGPITLETVGLKFQGASGPIIFWLLCMLLIIYGINKLWEK